MHSVFTRMVHGCMRERQRRESNKCGLCDTHFGWATEQRRYVGRKERPVNPFVVKYSEQAMPPQHSDAAPAPRLNLCWCIQKARQEWATGTQRSRNQSALPLGTPARFCCNSRQEMDANVWSFFLNFNPFLCLCWPKPFSAARAFHSISHGWCILKETSNKNPGILSKHGEVTTCQFGLVCVHVVTTVYRRQRPFSEVENMFVLIRSISGYFCFYVEVFYF